MYGNAAFKLLTVLVFHSNSTGTCWPSRALLMLETGMSARAVDYGIADLKTGGAISITKVRKVSTYRLSGASNEWQTCNRVQPSTATKCSPVTAPECKQNPSSSEPQKEPNNRGNLTAVGAEPYGVTTGLFQGFSEEEGATARTGKGFAALGTATVVEAEPERQCAAPPPAAGPEEVAAWMELHVSPIPGDGEIALLLDHTWDVWEYPAHPYGWKYGKEAANKHCTKDTTARKKFRVDVVEKLLMKGLPRTASDGQIQVDPVRCGDCGSMTATPKKVMRIGDERIADGCGDCDRAKCRNAGCTAPAEKVAINLGGMLLPEVYCLPCAHLLHPETEQAYRRCECGGLVSLSWGTAWEWRCAGCLKAVAA